jgi:DNA processing protein
MDELLTWLHFSSIPGIGPITGGQILRQYSLQQLWQADSVQLSSWGWKPEQIHFWQNFSPDQYRAVLTWLEVPHHHVLPLDHPLYPQLLHQTADAPLVLFVSGQAELLNQQQIAMVGSRHPTADGRRAAFTLAGQLAERGAIVTSGLAKGIDACCHQAALQQHGLTIAVQGCGLGHVYPATHHQLAHDIVAQGGAIVSEFFPHIRPRPEFFPRRNRIISGMSMGTVVIEAAAKSGSLITAYAALDQNREVFAVPGVFDNDKAAGCHQLIQRGAKLVCSVADIEEELGSFSILPTKSTVSDQKEESVRKIQEEQPTDLPFHRLLDNVMRDEVTSIDILAAKSGLPVQEVMAELINLELEGLIMSVPGGYVRTRSA